MNDFFYLRVSLPSTFAQLLDAAISPNDPRFEDHMAVMGTDFFAEAHATLQARAAATGQAGRYAEFVSVSAKEVEASEYPVAQLAIGPALDEEGFEEVALPILAAILNDYEDIYPDRPGSLEVTIARVRYTAWFSSSTRVPSISFAPLFTTATTERDDRTASWLADFLTKKVSVAAA